MTVSRFRFSLLSLSIGAILAGCSGQHSEFGGPPLAVSSSVAQPHKSAGNEAVVYNFTGGADGGNAATAIALDKSGNAYGTTVVGGTYQCGTIFELNPQSKLPWSETPLYDFTCYSDGKNPHGGVTLDAQGNLDGTTVAGGPSYCTGDGCGVVYQYKAGVERVLYDFTGGNDGFGPGGAVTIDKAGNMYGTTPDGGASGVGTIYEITRAGKFKVLHAFTGGDDGGTGSLGSLLLDSSGNLYGVTESGGQYSSGTAYRLTPAKNGKWKFATIYAFKGTPDAGSPYGGLIEDAGGILYGTTYYGGTNSLGSVYALLPKGSAVTERVLYSFKGGSDASLSTSTLAFGTGVLLYGTSSGGGGSCDCGTIFRVNAKTGKEKVLHSFGGANDGEYSYYGLTKESNGKFLGTTVAGGTKGQGTVFEFTP
ncbi:MAG TPA: choice-of-anchor tandem repeat GloVer-containing protein [Candidatus Tumulicola sp.]|jgi:uncharacterized repeat protein (TIGR03803 family)